MENENNAIEWAINNPSHIDTRIINLIIEDLKEIEVSPETMVHIIKQVGLEEQVFKHLMSTRPF